ncbi:MAG: OmpA family protein [bacterium]|nr:OmpA family protein [bacterium]
MKSERVSRSTVPIAIIWLVPLWVLVVLIAVVWGMDNAEAKLRDSTHQALQEAGIDIDVDISGRDATLSGAVGSTAAEAEIVAMIDAVDGVRRTSSELVVMESPVEVVTVPRIEVRLIGDAVSIRGLVPDAETEAGLVTAAEQQFGIDRVVNSLTISDDVGMLPWVGRIKDVFGHIGDLRSGEFVADESGFAISGEVVSESIRAGIEQEIRLILDGTLPLASNLAIAVLPAPSFSASGSAGVVILNGAFPNQETVDQIADAARRLHPGTTIVNSMRVREVAGPTWLESIAGLLDVATRLEPWTIDIVDGAVAISGLSLDPGLVGAIDVLADEVVGGQLAVETDIQVDPIAVAQQLTELLRGEASFGPNEANLSAAGRTLLDEAIEILAANPASRLIVEGHTDSLGDSEANLELSQQRADAVVAYLVAGGIDADRLTAIGYGEGMPIADNVSEVGRAQNRRIEFVISEGDE